MERTRNDQSGPVTRNITQLYEKHGLRLRRYIEARVDCAADAEDILQDVFLAVSRDNVTNRVRPRTEAYLCGIAKHLVAKHLRQKTGERNAREKKRRSSLPVHTLSRSHDVDIERIRILLERLPSTSREALKLRYLEDLAPKDAAARLGCSDHAFHQRLHAAIKALRVLALKSERALLKHPTRQSATGSRKNEESPLSA